MASRHGGGGNNYRRYGTGSGGGGGNRFNNGGGTFKRGQISVDRKRSGPPQQNGHSGPVNKISRFN